MTQHLILIMLVLLASWLPTVRLSTTIGLTTAKITTVATTNVSITAGALTSTTTRRTTYTTVWGRWLLRAIAIQPACHIVMGWKVSIVFRAAGIASLRRWRVLVLWWRRIGMSLRSLCTICWLASLWVLRVRRMTWRRLRV
jgi:hypothetical protein